MLGALNVIFISKRIYAQLTCIFAFDCLPFRYQCPPGYGINSFVIISFHTCVSSIAKSRCSRFDLRLYLKLKLLLNYRNKEVFYYQISKDWQESNDSKFPCLSRASLPLYKISWKDYQTCLIPYTSISKYAVIHCKYLRNAVVADSHRLTWKT